MHDWFMRGGSWVCSRCGAEHAHGPTPPRDLLVQISDGERTNDRWVDCDRMAVLNVHAE